MSKLEISETLLLRDIFEKGVLLKTASKNLNIGDFIHLIRKKLCLSQDILAQRCGLKQTQISRIEKGLSNPGVETLKKICDALFCDLLIIPIPKQDLDSIKQRVAKKVAKKRIDYIHGTMSLEKQSPDSEMINEMLRQEEQSIINNFESKLWNEIDG